MSNQKNQNQALPKSFEDLSDVEFIAYADYLSSPYYKTYLQAKNTSSMVNKEDVYANAIRPNSKSGAAVAGGVAYRRRKGFLALVVIFMVAILAIGVLGYLGNIVPEYISVFTKDDSGVKTYIGITDPIFAALNKFAGMDMDSVFFADWDAMPADAEIATKIAYFGLPIAAALALLFTLIILIVAIAALAKKGVEKGYVARKCKFGFLSLLLFLFSIFIAACGVIWNGAGLGEIMNFFTASTTKIYAGYGLFGIIGLALLSMICNWLSYKKVR
ncbi:MAG: hypothetical protein PHC84_04520 [Clostridia bacterium]|nr:hypothetical protein [Clostridia bacterium]